VDNLTLRPTAGERYVPTAAAITDDLRLYQITVAQNTQIPHCGIQ
jgi:hypothetical protein